MERIYKILTEELKISLQYHYFDSDGNPHYELIAGAYAERQGTLGFDEQLSTTSRNGVENRVITNRILQDEADYLLKATASTLYVAKADFATELNTAIQAYYPVGTIYMNDVATTVPFDFGTWQLIDEKFLYGCASDFSDIGDTGGNATVTLALANLPSDSVSITIPALTGTAASASTEHTHSGTTDANNRGHTHSGTTSNSGVGGSGHAFTPQSGSIALGSCLFLNETNTSYFHTHSFTTGDESQNHTHTFTTGNMSANSTHTHTVTTDASSTSVSLGSDTAFSIIPPYHKCAIWHRTA